MTPQKINKVRPKICIIQITRLGDLIQTYLAAKSFKKQNPDILLSLVARRKFAKPLVFLLAEIFDEIHYLDTDHILQKNSQLIEARKKLKDFLHEVNNSEITVCANFSFSTSSTYLASLIKANYKIGPYRDKSGNIVIDDRWSQYVYSNVMTGPYNPFNLVNIYEWILGVKPQAKVSAITTKKPSLVKKNPKIFIHPFSSQPRKNWGVVKWREIIYQLLKGNPQASIHLVGSIHEKFKAREILEDQILAPYSQQIVNLVGQTTIEELYGLLGDADLFIGHDSMVGHLASIQGVSCLTITLGSVRTHETIPHALGNFSLTPKVSCFPCFPDETCTNFICHNDISHQHVLFIANNLLRNQELNEQLLLKYPQIEATQFPPTYKSINSTDLLLLEDPFNSLLNIDDTFKRFYTIIWSFLLNDCEYNLNIPKINKETLSKLEKSLIGLENLYELHEFGEKFCGYILKAASGQTPNISEINSYSKKLLEIDQLEKILSDSFPQLSPIINFYNLARANVIGSTLIELTEQSLIMYIESKNTIKLLYEFVEKTLAHNRIEARSSKPISVGQNN